MSKHVQAATGTKPALIAILIALTGAGELAATELTPIAFAPVPGETYYAATIDDAR